MALFEQMCQQSRGRSLAMCSGDTECTFHQSYLAENFCSLHHAITIGSEVGQFRVVGRHSRGVNDQRIGGRKKSFRDHIQVITEMNLNPFFDQLIGNGTRCQIIPTHIKSLCMEVASNSTHTNPSYPNEIDPFHQFALFSCSTILAISSTIRSAA